MSKKCDNTSVAAIIKKDNRILLIERKKYNPGWALPAGHQDDNDAERDIKRELKEEVGLTAEFMRIRLMITLQNPCSPKRGGLFHRWIVFFIEKWNGEVKTSKEEVLNYVWADEVMLKEFARRLEEFAAKNKLVIENKNLPALVKATNESDLWKRSPGLEPPMYIIFKQLRIA